MRKIEQIEQLYLDFDGFFASVEQQARPALQGKPIGVTPFNDTKFTVVIACSKEAKRRGVKNVMNIAEAQRICPEIILVPQSPDLYRRAHNALISEINCVTPIEAIKSIDEITCRVQGSDTDNPQQLGERIKTRLANTIGKHITCSIGFAANRQLAKMAGKCNKPDGITVWHPRNMPEPLLKLGLEEVPGIGSRLLKRLHRAGIITLTDLYDTQPKQMRKLWKSVTGERLWYALHGYDIRARKSERGMFGHGRVLPPESRDHESAQDCSRLLLVKASRRMRRAGFSASGLSLWIAARRPYTNRRPYSNHIAFQKDSINQENLITHYSKTEKRDYSQSCNIALPQVQDEFACLQALWKLWHQAKGRMEKEDRIIRLGVTLYDLTPNIYRQLDLLRDDDETRLRHEKITACLDYLNQKYSRTIISYGGWRPPKGGYAGGKISYTRIPSAEDFY